MLTGSLQSRRRGPVEDREDVGGVLRERAAELELLDERARNVAGEGIDELVVGEQVREAGVLSLGAQLGVGAKGPVPFVRRFAPPAPSEIVVPEISPWCASAGPLRSSVPRATSNVGPVGLEPTTRGLKVQWMGFGISAQGAKCPAFTAIVGAL
ncbi:hypothetical protein [Homoserinibacter sp. YIM 151385]|uniref:hypothetical protein n=1 Tax=Homoserinibacter sp. YIM 151385 TaxID=2985506 RepID=UPI0022F133A9|nr:hypothetical protein [Homoserinibacter sp. YIM 151385]WBU36715.1 hypothetical protein OF852_07130 [Homoserinibacter sp. YIM 151385]